MSTFHVGYGTTDGKFLNALYDFNNKYLGLGLAATCLSSGIDKISGISKETYSSLVTQLLEQNGDANTIAGASGELNAFNSTKLSWATATPAERRKSMMKSGVAQIYKFVSGYQWYRQQGKGKDSETGENDDIAEGKVYNYVTNTGDIFKTYVNANGSISTSHYEGVQNGGAQSGGGLWNVYNASEYTIYFKPETSMTIDGISYNNSSSYPLAPGQSFNHRVDGIGIPGGRPGEVFKVKSFMDSSFGVKVYNNTVIIGEALWPVTNDVNQLFGGGWKGQDWLNSLHNQTDSNGNLSPDNSWDSLFNRVR